MFLHTSHGEVQPGLGLILQFNNGVTGEVCLMNELLGEVFEPLKDEALFATARQDDVMVAMVWTSANVSRFNLAFDFSGGDHGLIAACECKSR